ncbi:unnamed protein product [Rhizoctonia solani]|uniref:Uncharacterized protein n=1 Tax=Rhizoctonia solani TaxID=456999 RepID=A0A8H2X3K6_9AGAM|nr:unnamed protein product [Rhizoctonia solani]
MATVAKTRRRLSRITGIIHYKLIRPTLLATKTVANIVDPLGLRQSGSGVFGVVEALKAPKQNRVKAQDQIAHIDQTIAYIHEEVSANTQEGWECRATYLLEAQKFVDKLKELKEKLVKATKKGYLGRFANQRHISEVLETFEMDILKAEMEFLRSESKFNVRSSQSHYS